jgi:capping protein beta
MSAEVLRSSLDLFRRLPPQNISSNLDLVLGLLPELTEDILAEIDQPLIVKLDSSGKEYLVKSFNVAERG